MFNFDCQVVKASVIIFLVLLPSVTYQAGVSTHLTIAARVHLYLPEDIKEYYNEYLAGAFHPDAFYNCFDQSEAAEEAHWPPFLLKAVEYYKNGNGSPELKAFIYGVFTHQVTDVSWHSLYKSQGLLEQLSKVEFDGNKSSAHDFLDTGGDFLVLAKQFGNVNGLKLTNLLKFYGTSWSYPENEILDIYSNVGYSITNSELRFCMMRGFAGLQAEVATIGSIDEQSSLYYVIRSPLLREILDDYYYGGINEIVHSIRMCMNGLNIWFENDLNDDHNNVNPWSICSTFVKHRINSLDEIFAASPEIAYMPPTLGINNTRGDLTVDNGNEFEINLPTYLSTFITNSMFGSSLKVGNYLNGELCIAIGANYDEETGSTYIIPIGDIFSGFSTSEEQQLQALKLKPTVNSHLEPADQSDLQYPPRFGYSMANWNVNGLEFLVISEPGTSSLRVFSQLENQLVAIIYNINTTTSSGLKGIKELGMVLDTNDINNDTYDDLIFGSHNTDYKGKLQIGHLSVLSGYLFNSIIESEYYSKILSDASGVLHLSSDQLEIAIYDLPLELQLSDNYEQFATTVAFTRSYTLVGVNSLGSVLVFEKNGKYQQKLSIGKNNLPENERRVKSEDSHLFGFNFILTGSYNETSEWVLISASSETSGVCVLCGSSYLYLLTGNNFDLTAKITPSMAINNKHSYFGTSAIHFKGNSVLISSEGYNRGMGAIWLADINQIIDTSTKSSKVLHVELGDEIKTLNENDDTDFVRSFDLKILTRRRNYGKLLVTGVSGVGFTGFGRSLETFDYNGCSYLAVAMPYYGYGDLYNDDTMVSGKVGFYKMV